MRASTLDVLACPSCRAAYRLQAYRQDGDEILAGYLRCTACAIVIPIVEGFPLFTEPRLHAGLVTAEAIDALSARLFGTEDDYRRYMALKAERGMQEDYAAFGPFNEATRSIEALERALDTHLAPGDFILDTWCRTGWSGETLASRYPEQKVVSIWEGDNSVLGYRGFRFWLNHRRRAPNLDIVFTHPEKPLPFRTGAFGGLLGQDSLHRYGLYPFAGECLRVTRKDGCLMFPHVHLTNNEPDPWFDRGCRQDHGLDYRAWLDAALAGEARHGVVLSEPRLFAERAGAALADEPETSDYNGAVLIADPARGVSRRPADAATLAPGMRLLLNPLFRISLQRMEARIDDGWRGGGVGHYLDRHPLYRRHLPQKPVPLSAGQLVLVALVAIGRTVGEIAERFGEPVEALARRLAPLIELDLILPAPVSAAALEMQRFHANQLGAPGPHPLAALLESLAAGEAPLALAPDGSGATGPELRETAAVLGGALAARGLKAGDALVLDRIDGQLGLALLLAAAALGLDVAFTSAPWQGARPALLLQADGLAPPEQFADAALPLGLDGAPGSLLGAAEGGPPLALDGDIPTTGTINPSTDDQRLKLPVADLIDAGYALRRSADVSFAAVGDLDEPASLLVALISLAAGEPFQVEA